MLTLRTALPEKAQAYDRILKILQIQPSGTRTLPIEEAYSYFDIGEYDPYAEVTAMEVNLMLAELGGPEAAAGKRVHDAACGTGRHLAGLQKIMGKL